MAGRRRQGERVEPSFGRERDRDEEIRLSPDDRAARAAGEPERPARGKERRSAARTRQDEPEPAEKRRRFFGGGRGGSGESRPRRRRSFLGHLFRLALFAAVWGSVAAVGVVVWFAASLPSEAWNVPARPPNVKMVSVAGEPFANRGITGGQALSLAEMSPFIPKAVVAIEDRRFYDHYGVDPIGIGRALAENLAAGATVQGGSTLTQQLAKNIFLTPEQSLKRKGQEAILALWLEQKFSKDQILEMYLNRVYFGSGSTGVEAASQRYFRKSAKDVSLSEAALLAGLLKAPSRLSPANDPVAAKARADVVLQAMRDENAITEAEFEAAKAEKPIRAKSFWNGAENYAADLVMRDLSTLVGEVKGDVAVETTIDLGLERDAEKAIRSTIDGAKQNVSQGALVAVDGTGAIRALVGGRDYADSQFNRAVDARRQPGSAFKPFVYETALEAGWRPDSVVNDAPTRIGNWSPQNYDQRYRGPVTLADALAHSLNTIAAQLTEAVGSKAVIETAARMGVKTPLVDNASIALGTSEVTLLELTSAYAVFANGGYQATPHLINKVTDVASGKVLYERPAGVPPVIVKPEIVGMMNAMLTGTITRGTGRRAALKDWQAAGKSGTTQDFKDAWFMGYTANLTTGVWLGNDNGALMKKVTGGTLPADVWKKFMAAAHEGLPPMPLPGVPDTAPGEAGTPLTASNGMDGGDPAAIAGEAPSGEAIAPPGEIPAVAGHGQPESGDPIGAIAGREYPEPERRIIRRDDGRGPASGAPYSRDLPPDDPYGVSPLPDDGAYEELPPDGVAGGYDDREIAPPPPADLPPARGPSRLVRRDQLPPDAVLEGPVEEQGRPVDRSLLRDFLGG
ncbi:PBP1A family penicillin-binding protein [Aureimonas leprariae]|uniref:PBP1A family penicillin-binding protein n=1 Tax=Plantimonas leprariae TaxID=2615207 RepID=A0A7V7PTD5_9HYPH|nr:transglycosylase domain-containing protein [Aureimonas leprariae]KAB0682926.1 PBP1A family penicillin-binding protein [Aureimonas leprariae]